MIYANKSSRLYYFRYLILNNFILGEELFGKALQSFETFLLISKKLWGKLVSSFESRIRFDESFRVTLVALFIADFILLSSELDNFIFEFLY